MKRFASLIILILAVQALIGANGAGVGYQALQYGELPEEIRTIVDSRPGDASSHVLPGPDGSQYLYIGLGRRPTGGYGIAIQDIKRENEGLIITYKEIKPAEGAMVTQAITYPWIVIKVDSTLPIKVVGG
jgi:hypothetical protein